MFSSLAAAPGNCKPPPVVENAVVISPYQDEYRSYSYVYYKCRDDYTIGREDALQCRDGNWEEKDITCSHISLSLPVLS